MGVKCIADFSDVDAFFAEGDKMVEDAMTEAGRNAVRYAEEHGNYKDHTGTLRKSNKFEVEDGKLTLFNDAKSSNGYPYAGNVESKGYDVLSGAALEAESELKRKFE